MGRLLLHLRIHGVVQLGEVVVVEVRGFAAQDDPGASRRRVPRRVRRRRARPVELLLEDPLVPTILLVVLPGINQVERSGIFVRLLLIVLIRVVKQLLLVLLLVMLVVLLLINPVIQISVTEAVVRGDNTFGGGLLRQLAVPLLVLVILSVPRVVRVCRRTQVTLVGVPVVRRGVAPVGRSTPEHVHGHHVVHEPERALHHQAEVGYRLKKWPSAPRPRGEGGEWAGPGEARPPTNQGPAGVHAFSVSPVSSAGPLLVCLPVR